MKGVCVCVRARARCVCIGTLTGANISIRFLYTTLSRKKNQSFFKKTAGGAHTKIPEMKLILKINLKSWRLFTITTITKYDKVIESRGR